MKKHLFLIENVMKLKLSDLLKFEAIHLSINDF